MAGITLADAEAQLAAWLAASLAVAKGQAYSIGGRSLTRANAKEIRDSIAHWDQIAQGLGGSGIVIKGATPIG